MKVLIVGQNPSKYNLDPKLAFVGTKSYDIIEDMQKSEEGFKR
jgi:hypothetical protein